LYTYHIITLFPELFDKFVTTSLIGKASEKGLLSFSIINLRDFTHDRHRTVDDSPYGGGAGMVMKTQPVWDVLNKFSDCYKILMTPGGRRFVQQDARRLAELKVPLLLFCGRYEGVDQRVCSRFDEQISIGDFVLNGGEIAAMAVIEATARLIPGVIGNMNSVVEESFSNGLLEYPHYTRPEIIGGQKVPDVLLSGNHRAIKEWRKGQSLLKTYLERPDLFKKYSLTGNDQELLQKALEERDKN
jgi:tRNA (guanine37-N1)-methyltransferase